jgi:hypothetical protein
MITVSYVICGHKSRSAWAWTLAEQIGCPVVLDEGDRGSLANHDLAWVKGATHADITAVDSWVCVLEDDAILCPWFRHQVTQAIEHRPFGDAAISLYTGTAKPKQNEIMNALKRAGTNDSAWLASSAAYWGVGLLLPTRFVPGMLDYVRDRTEPYDERISYYLRDQNLPVLYTRPSLVDHRDSPSLIKMSILPRHAHQFDSRTVWNDQWIPVGRWRP